MNKWLLVLIIVLLSSGLSGCYYDTSKRNMELLDVKVYDDEGNEVPGDYVNYPELFLTVIQPSQMGFKSCNSAAPVENYYCIDAVELASYTILFYFRSINNKVLSKLILSDGTGEGIMECDNIETIDNQYVVTVVVEQLTSEIQLLHTNSWYDDKGTSHTFTTMGSNTYIKGVYFKLEESTEPVCFN